MKDIVKELGFFLGMAGVRMRTERAGVFSTKILALVKRAYNLRTAMAEKDICGGLEVVVVGPDTPFEEKWMTDAHVGYRKYNDTTHSGMDIVVGTSGMGLQRKVLDEMKIELKPKVVLDRALK